MNLLTSIRRLLAAMLNYKRWFRPMAGAPGDTKTMSGETFRKSAQSLSRRQSRKVFYHRNLGATVKTEGEDFVGEVVRVEISKDDTRTAFIVNYVISIKVGYGSLYADHRPVVVIPEEELSFTLKGTKRSAIISKERIEKLLDISAESVQAESDQEELRGKAAMSKDIASTAERRELADRLGLPSFNEAIQAVAESQRISCQPKNRKPEQFKDYGSGWSLRFSRYEP